MASIAQRANVGASTHWLDKGLRFADDQAQSAAIEVLHQVSTSRPDYDLATDSRDGRGILVVSNDDFVRLAAELKKRGIPFQEITVRPMSDLPPDVQRHARGLMH